MCVSPLALALLLQEYSIPSKALSSTCLVQLTLQGLPQLHLPPGSFPRLFSDTASSAWSTSGTGATSSSLTTSQPVLKNRTTPKMLIMQDVNTPSQVPNSTGSHMKSWIFHQGWGWARAPCQESAPKSAEPPLAGPGRRRGVGQEEAGNPTLKSPHLMVPARAAMCFQKCAHTLINTHTHRGVCVFLFGIGG